MVVRVGGRNRKIKKKNINKSRVFLWVPLHFRIYINTQIVRLLSLNTINPRLHTQQITYIYHTSTYKGRQTRNNLHDFLSRKKNVIFREGLFLQLKCRFTYTIKMKKIIYCTILLFDFIIKSSASFRFMKRIATNLIQF